MMKRLALYGLVSLVIFNLLAQQSPSADLRSWSVAQWYKQSMLIEPGSAADTALVSYEDFVNILHEYIESQKKNLAQSAWLGDRIDSESSALKDDFTEEIEQPFALKVTVPSAGSAYFWGDLHGDLQALAVSLKILQDKKNVINDAFEVIQPDTYFFFLGDMVDRGKQQMQMLFLLITFALKNPGKVFLIRGNHENLMMSNDYGFQDQLKELFTRQHPETVFDTNNPIFESISLFYNLMPDVAFVGCNNNYLQCCHGGIEIRYNPKNLLAQEAPVKYQLIKKSLNSMFINDIVTNDGTLKALHIDPSGYKFFSERLSENTAHFFKKNLGFFWGDFNNNPQQEYSTFYNPNRGLFSGKKFTQQLLDYYSTDSIKVRAIIRAHQHNATLPGILSSDNKGIYTIWDTAVITQVSTRLFNDVIAFNKITFFDEYSAWMLTNYSCVDGRHVDGKTKLLQHWINNKSYDQPAAPAVVSANAVLLEKAADEIEKKDPDYNLIKKLLSDIKKDPLINYDLTYEHAQTLLKNLTQFTNALNFFYKNDYESAEIGFGYLLDEGLFKFKAREYYAKTVIAAHMESEYDNALEILYNTVADDAAALVDQQEAHRLLGELNDLMQPEDDFL